MKKKKVTLAAALQRPRAEAYVLKLFVAGASSRSVRTIRRLKHLCETHLHGRYSLDVIDIYQRPQLAREHQIIATPTLIKLKPGTVRRFVGDLTEDRLIFGLALGAAP